MPSTEIRFGAGSFVEAAEKALEFWRNRKAEFSHGRNEAIPPHDSVRQLDVNHQERRPHEVQQPAADGLGEMNPRESQGALHMGDRHRPPSHRHRGRRQWALDCPPGRTAAAKMEHSARPVNGIVA